MHTNLLLFPAARVSSLQLILLKICVHQPAPLVSCVKWLCYLHLTSLKEFTLALVLCNCSLRAIACAPITAAQQAARWCTRT